MKKIISYIYPVTKKIKTDKNGLVEITYYNGKKILDSANANYSYGNLQKVLKFGLNKVNFNSINDILILGLGAGSVIETIRHDFHSKASITAVEIDAKIIDIAYLEFNLNDFSGCNIICDDAYQFINNTSLKFDLIVIDLFIDENPPLFLQDMAFWERIHFITNNHAYIIYNSSMKQDKTKESKEISAYINQEFKTQMYGKVENANTVYVMQKINQA